MKRKTNQKARRRNERKNAKHLNQETKYLAAVNREQKSRLFELLFSQKRELLELYNAVNNTSYQDTELLEINTLKNAIYMGMRNDVSFIIMSHLQLYEHQSTYNPNMPLRFLLYVSDLYSEILCNENIYGHRLITFPSPHFLIFYNGEEERPDREIIKLSSAYITKEEEPALELTAIQLNINYGHNSKLMEASRTLAGYAEYNYRVRKYIKIMSLEGAVEKAIEECIEEGILSDFLRRNRAEVKKVSIYEYDEARHMAQVKEEGREEGQELINRLNRCLLLDNRMDDLRRSVQDAAFQKKLLEEYNLNHE